MQSIIRALTITLIVGAIAGLLITAKYYGKVTRFPSQPQNAQAVAPIVTNSNLEAPPFPDDDSQPAEKESDDKVTISGPNQIPLVEGVYVRIVDGVAKECSLSAFAKLGLRKKNGSGYFIVGDDVARLEESYPLSYNIENNSCSFILDEGSVKYEYTCLYWPDDDTKKPRLRITDITTTVLEQSQNANAPLPGESSCYDGEEFILK